MFRALRSIAVLTARIWDPLYAYFYRIKSGYRGPIPPFANRRRIASRKIGVFMRDGHRAYQRFSQEIERESRTALHDADLLDFGSGCGRIAQYFDGACRSLVAVDVDASAVAYLRKEFPTIHSEINRPKPPLEFDDASFDVVYSFSVWTHLDPPAQEEWLVEIARVLRPQGIALITTQGPTFLRSYLRSTTMDPPWRQTKEKDLLREGALHKPFSYLQHPRSLVSGVSGTYGMSFNTAEHIRQRWGRHLHVVHVLDGETHCGQDLVVLRKVISK